MEGRNELAFEELNHNVKEDHFHLVNTQGFNAKYKRNRNLPSAI